MEFENKNHDQDRKEILAHIDSIFKAFINKDKDTIRNTHLPQWKGYTVRSRGTVHTREKYMQEVESLLEHQHWKFYEMTDTDIAFFGDTAVVSYIATVSGKDPQEKYFETKLRVLDVYIKIDGAWNLAASHVSLHPDVIDSKLNAAISALTLS
jgi:ketosteroid isomerase-like protein